MKFFQTFRERFAILGFHPDQSLEIHPLNARIGMGFLILSVTMALESLYLWQETHNLMECAQTVFLTTITFIIFIILAILPFQMDAIFKLIDAYEILCDGK